MGVLGVLSGFWVCMGWVGGCLVGWLVDLGWEWAIVVSVGAERRLKGNGIALF